MQVMCQHGIAGSRLMIVNHSRGIGVAMKTCLAHAIPSFVALLCVLSTPFSEAETHELGTHRTAFTLSEVDRPPRLTKKIDPAYPPDAKKEHVQGKVTIRFVVTKDGRVIEPTVEEAEPPAVFDSSALEAVSKWRFKPAIKDGKKVNIILTVPLIFGLTMGPEDRFREITKQGADFADSGEYEKAIEAYGELIELTPKHHGVYYNRGFVYSKWGRHKKAAKDFTKAIKLGTKTARNYVARSISYRKLGKLRKACKDLTSACELGDCSGLDLARNEDLCK